MKSLKKTLVLLVVFSMILSAVMPAFAATDIYGLDCEEEVARLEALKVVTGYEDGTYGPEKTITRAEMAVILCKMVGIDTVTVDENANVPSKFSDVKAGEWYTGYVNVAAGKGLLSGFPDGTFRPSEQLTMNQVLTLCVNALGRGEYVAEMGTWPANYIAEATKLGLLDGVKTSDANRGNVAIIVWNTLEAPYVWDVEATEFEGTINLMNSKRSLLSIYFRDYTYDVGNEVRELKEIETVVASTPSRNSEIGDRQIVLADVDADFDFKTTFKKKDVKEECTYINDEDEVVAYVPEEVYEDIDSLRGKTVTVVFGKDNVVALIVIEDEIIENEFLTEYAIDDNKIVVGGTTYKLAKKYDVILNDNGYDDLETALTAVGVKDYEDIVKNIQAQLTLDIDGKVEKIALFASYTIPGVSTEAVVTKVRETSKKCKIETTAGNIEWDIDEEEDIDFPRVYVDGTKGDIRDIAVGNVLTILGETLDVEDITTIYVSTNTVVGEAKRIRKADQAITMDGEVYLASKAVEDENGNFASIMIDEEIDDPWAPFSSTTILDNEEVTLYMNILGEYVAVGISEVTTDYQFGIVTALYDSTSYEVVNDDEYAIRTLRILTADGNTSRYSVRTNVDDKDTPDQTQLDTVVDALTAGKFVMFKANADRVITLEKEVTDEILEVTQANAGDDYTVLSVAKDNVVTTKSKTFKLLAADTGYTTGTPAAAADYEGVATSKTVIFNNHLKDANDADDKTNREVVTSWDAIVESNKIDTTYAGATFVFDADDEEALYIVVDMKDYTSSDAEYAIVDAKLHEDKDDVWTIGFVGNEELVEVKKALAEDVSKPLVDAKDWFIRYTTSSGKVDSAVKLVDLDAFANDLADEELITSAVISAGDATISLPAKFAKYTKTHLEVVNVEEDKDYAYLEYVKDVEKDVTAADVFATGVYYVEEIDYEKVEVASADYQAGTYYTLVSGNYVKEAAGSTYDADTTYYEQVTERVLAKEYDDTETYYLSDDLSESATLTHANLAVATTIGKVWLDADHIIVLDVSEGEVKEASLADVEGRLAIVYADPDCDTTNNDGNVVIILD